MARATQSFRNTTVAALIAAVNAYLFPFTGGSARKVIQVSIIMNALDRHMGQQFTCTITTESSGAAAQTSPYTLSLLQAGNPTDIDAAIATVLLTAAATFSSGWRSIGLDNPSQLPQLYAWALLCADGTNGPTNYTPL